MLTECMFNIRPALSGCRYYRTAVCYGIDMLIKSREVRTEATGLAGMVQSVYFADFRACGPERAVRIYSGRRQRFAAEIC